MADYRVLLDGMVAASQTTMVPAFVMKTVLAPRLSRSEDRCARAPLGLRRLEASLLSGGFHRNDVALVDPDGLAKVVGPATRVVGISTGDPLGQGMNSTTMQALAGGRTYTRVWFERLVQQVHALAKNNAGLKIVVGGPGAWQLAQDESARRRLGIDHVILGYCEERVAEIFRQLCDGVELPALVNCPPSRSIPPGIHGPTLMGVVEITRGCGWGCDFCTMAAEPMLHFSMETILEDARVNVRGGQHEIALIGEDVFRYKDERAGSNGGGLKELLVRLRTIEGLGRMHIDHANVVSVARTSNDDLREIASLLSGGDDRRYLWVNLGVETASGKLLAATCRAKMRPFAESEWAEACLEQVRRLSSAGFVPMVSLLLGLREETEDDVEQTLRWVGRLKGMRVTVFPMFLAATEPEQKSFTSPDMKKIHWQIFRECYRLNFKGFPRLVWENQRTAGAPMWRRLILQGLGRAAVPAVKTMLALRCRGR